MSKKRPEMIDTYAAKYEALRKVMEALNDLSIEDQLTVLRTALTFCDKP